MNIFQRKKGERALMFNGKWLMSKLEQEDAEVSVAAFLSQLTLHSFGCNAKKEGDEVLIGVLTAYLAQGIDVSSAVLDVNDKEGMTGMQEDPVGEQASCAPIAVAKRMYAQKVKVECGKCNE